MSKFRGDDNGPQQTTSGQVSDEILKCYGGDINRYIRSRDRTNWRAKCRDIVTTWFQERQESAIEDAKERLIRAYRVKENNTLAIPGLLSEVHMIQLAMRRLLPMPPGQPQPRKVISDEQRQANAEAVAERMTA